jgi:lipoyl(octanoyl) transferase
VENKVEFVDFGRIEYAKAWDLQRVYFGKVVSSKDGSGQLFREHFLLFCEHPHVYTIGKSGKMSNLLINDDFLKKVDATVFTIDRGGDITYHGPGQVVGYPILDLESIHLGIKEYVHNLEEVIIHVLLDYGILGSRLTGATGVWLEPEISGKARKICAIGIKASRYVTMHGFAFNVNTDLSYFNHINPCGFVDKGVTSLEKELGRNVNLDEVKTKIIYYFSKIFRMDVD